MKINADGSWIPKLKYVQILLLVGLLIFVIRITHHDPINNADISDIAAEIVPSLDQDSVTESTNLEFKRFYNLEPQDYAGVVLYRPYSNMDAEELLLVKLNDPAQSEPLTKAIEARILTQQTSFDGYAPEQYDLVCNAITDVQGNFVLFVVSEQAGQIDDLFRKALKERK